MLRPLQQAEDWINDPRYAGAPDRLSLPYLEHHAAVLLQSYAAGKLVSGAAATALQRWFFNQRAVIYLVDRYENPLLISYRGLPRQGGEAVSQLLSKLAGTVPLTGVDETTGASIFSAFAEFAGAGEVVSALAVPAVGALVWFFATPDVAESN